MGGSCPVLAAFLVCFPGGYRFSGGLLFTLGQVGLVQVWGARFPLVRDRFT